MLVKVAFLFPGQGAQAPGMGKDFAEAFPEAARVFEEASDVLGWDVADCCFNGPQEELDRTAVSQPTILTTSMAVVAAMEAVGRPEVAACAGAAGLSLGEYSALVMARALTFADALQLVQKRGRFMEEACAENPGTMMSVLGLDDDIVQAICAQARADGMVVAANFNCPGQVVISGTRGAVERAADLARERGAKRVVPLAVSGAFHSPLMAPAAERLEPELEATPFTACRMAVIANVSAEPVREPAEIRLALAKQVRSPVHWTRSVRRLVADGCRCFVEVAPGNVLSRLMKRIAPKVEVRSISSVDALRGNA